MRDKDIDSSLPAGALPHPAGLDGAPAAADDEVQQWLGCESLHPLTWLPTPAVGVAGLPDSD